MVKATTALKQALYEFCKEQVDQQIRLLNETLSSITASRNNETKSSVGDKYETGRAMMQLEEEQTRSQLRRTLENRNRLVKIDPEKMTESVQPGSLVICNTGNYFISIGLGKVKLSNEPFYCISIDSPVGNLLRQQKKGAQVNFNGRSIVIEDIC